MAIYLGNLSSEQIEARLGIKFPDGLHEFMKGTRQENVSIPMANGSWHCYDLPFVLSCGSREVATKIYEALKPFHDHVKTPLEFALVSGAE